MKKNAYFYRTFVKINENKAKCISEQNKPVIKENKN